MKVKHDKKGFAVLFPGQGSQYPGMLSDFYSRYKFVGKMFEESSSMLGFDLWEAILGSSGEVLSNTRISQIATLTSSVAMWKIWRRNGGEVPRFFAGHSLGEYSALVCSGSMSFVSAARLVCERGELMQKAVQGEEGAMSAIIGLDSGAVAKACNIASLGQVVSVSNLNSPDQTVISGHREAV